MGCPSFILVVKSQIFDTDSKPKALISEGKPDVRRCGSVPVRKALVLLVVGDGLLGAVRWLWFSFWETTVLASRCCY